MKLNTSARRHENLDGVNYLVVPAVLIVEGVLNGELITMAEAGAFPGAWDGRPVTLQHPQDVDGNNISANSPQVVVSSVVGSLFNTVVDGDRLKSELWLNVAKMERLGGDALTALRALERDEPLEVSTGYWCNVVPREGEWGGRQFTGQQYGVRPDHLALLPGGIGACNWADGCGAGRFNEGRPMLEKPKPLNRFMQMLGGLFRGNAEPSQNETTNALYTALTKALGMDRFYVGDVYDDAVVYTTYTYDWSEEDTYRRSYTLDADTLEVTLGEPERVIRRVSYEPVGNEGAAEPQPEAVPITNAQPCGCQEQPKHQEEVTMNKPKVDALIANTRTVFGEPDRAWLESLDDTRLEQLTPKDEPAPRANSADEAVGVLRGLADEETVSFIQDAVSAQKARRETVLTGLKGNARTPFSETELAAMSTPQLERLAVHMEATEPDDFSGRGGPIRRESEAPKEEAPLVLNSSQPHNYEAPKETN